MAVGWECTLTTIKMGARAPTGRDGPGADLSRRPTAPKFDAMPPRDPSPVPLRALVLSVASLLVPVAVWTLSPPGVTGEGGLLLWMTTLVPAFLLTYYRGWRGATLALAGGMAIMSLGHAVLAARGVDLPDWRFVLGLIVVYVGVALGIGILSQLLVDQRLEAERQALTDTLTGLPNRRHTQIVLDVAFDAARRGVPLSVAVVDLDRFKWLNDEHGHAAGDTVLRAFSRLLVDHLKEGESVGRWGGEEFLVILPGVGLDEAVRRVEQVRAALAAAELRWRPLTVSGGVSTYGSQVPNSEALVAMADEALYRAKDRGRDRVEAFRVDQALEARPSEEPPPPPTLSPAPSGEGLLPVEAAASRIVVIDDEQANLRAFGRGLTALGFQSVHTFVDAGEALEHVAAAGVDLILLDLHMEPLDGFGVLERLQPMLAEEGFLPVVILTGERDPRVKERALRMGGRDFLNKPVDLTELRARILNLLQTRGLHRQVREAALRLEDRVRERTRELEAARAEILSRLARTAEYRDDATGRHQERVGAISALLAERMGIEAEQVEILRQAAPLHDLGKIAIPDSILRKPGPLTPEEYAFMKQHTRLGAELLSGSTNRILEAARVIASSHHERWDGSGYPGGLAGEDIPVEGRIVAVADAFDSLTHRRSYKAAVPLIETMSRLLRDAGTSLDPMVTDALEHLYRSGLLDEFALEAD